MHFQLSIRGEPFTTVPASFLVDLIRVPLALRKFQKHQYGDDDVEDEVTMTWSAPRTSMLTRLVVLQDPCFRVHGLPSLTVHAGTLPRGSGARIEFPSSAAVHSLGQNTPYRRLLSPQSHGGQRRVCNRQYQLGNIVEVW